MNKFSDSKFHITVIGGEYIDLETSSGRSYKTLPKKLREPDDGYTHVNTFSYVVNDLACMPEMGGMMGVRNLAEIFDVSSEHLKRNILPRLDFIKYYAGIPVTNVSSAYAAAEFYHQQVNKSRCDRIGVSYADCTSGSLY